MKVQVDRTRCQGHGRCYDLMPDVFESDARGRVVLVVNGDLSTDLIPYTRVAVANCPEVALHLVGDEHSREPLEGRRAQ